MPRLILALLAVALAGLAACSKPPAPAATGFRDPAVPIYSNAVLDLNRLRGDWVQVATFAPAAAGCAPGAATIGGEAGALDLSARLCLGGAELAASGALAETGPGRLTPAQAGGVLAQPWWVIWADVDYRTLVIGTPSGDFGFILNRDGALPADRLTAAREVLDWNGYDLAQLQLF